MNHKTLTLLGFAKKANYVISGEEAVASFLKKNIIKMLVVAKDAPEKKKKQWAQAAREMDLEYMESSDKESLGIAIGTSPRAVIGILDEKMAKSLKNTER